MLVFCNNLRHLIYGIAKQNRIQPSTCLINRIYLSSEMEGTKYNLEDVISELESFADPKLAEPWDNVGLLVEPSSPHCVSKVLLTNDLTSAVLQEALNCKTDLIISYHPPIFAPLKRITQSSWKEKIVVSCLENRIAVYSPHTAWDATFGAVGDSLASAFGDYYTSVVPIIPNLDSELMFDVLTFQNNRDLFKEKVISSLPSSTIGKELYRISCNKNFAEELATLPDTIVTKVEPVKKNSNSSVGMGRKVELKSPGCSLDLCVQLVKKYTGLNYVRLSKAVNHNSESIIKDVALVPGSGGSFLKNVKADLFVTGEMFHHDLLDASHRGISVILTNHSDSERPYLQKFKNYLNSKLPSLDITVSSSDKDPIETV